MSRDERTGIETISGGERLAVPDWLLSTKPGEHYVLRVVGESMTEEGIHHGDYVVVLRREVAEPGEMVVALVGNDATLKRFYPEGPMVRLQPGNPGLDPIRVRAVDVHIQGIAVGVIRKL